MTLLFVLLSIFGRKESLLKKYRVREIFPVTTRER